MKEIRVAIVVEQGFVPTELALVLDVLRIAGRLTENADFSSRICTSGRPGLVEGKGGVLVRADPFGEDEEKQPDHLVVLGGTGIRDGFERLKARLCRYERIGQSIILLSDAASEWKRLYPDRDRITTHWEDHRLSRDAGCAPWRALPLFAQSTLVTTAAGMMAAADVVLNLIVAPVSVRLAQAVGNVLLMDSIRNGSAHQPRSEYDVAALRVAKLELVIAAMEENMEAPLTMDDLISVARMSARQLERKFKAFFGQSPMAFYRSMRLHRARLLVEQTALSVTEISIACGFGNSSNFSKLFAREFGFSPTRCRGHLSVAAPPRSPKTQTPGPGLAARGVRPPLEAQGDLRNELGEAPNSLRKARVRALGF